MRMLKNLAGELFNVKISKIRANDDLKGLCENEAFYKFISYLCDLYAVSFNEAECENNIHVRVGAIEKIKIIDRLLNFLDEYKNEHKKD